MMIVAPIKKTINFLAKNPKIIAFGAIIAFLQLILSVFVNQSKLNIISRLAEKKLFSSNLIGLAGFTLSSFWLDIIIILIGIFAISWIGVFSVFVITKSTKEQSFRQENIALTLKRHQKITLISIFLLLISVLGVGFIFLLRILIDLLPIIIAVPILLLFFVCLAYIGTVFIHFQQIIEIENISIKEALKKDFQFSSKRLLETFIVGFIIILISLVLGLIQNIFYSFFWVDLVKVNFAETSLVGNIIHFIPMAIIMGLSISISTTLIALHYLENK